MRSLPAPVAAPRTRCHCCRGPVRRGTDFETLHGKACCSADCRATVDNHLLSDPPEVQAEFIPHPDDRVPIGF